MISPSASPAELLEAYREGPAVLREAVAGLDAEALRARPIAGKMSSLEVLCHIVDSDQFMCDRMKRTIATSRPLLVGIESADYPGPLGYLERDPELDLRLLEVQREQLAADLDAPRAGDLGAHGHTLREWHAEPARDLPPRRRTPRGPRADYRG